MYQIIYNPKTFRSFSNESVLQGFLDEVFRTDLAQRWTIPLTRGNIYFLRRPDDTLEYFTNVTTGSRRAQLQQQLSDILRGVSIKSLRSDYAYISPDIEKGETLDMFSELTIETLPALWKADCPEKGQEDFFLDSTFLMVLLTDQFSPSDDTLCYKVVRLYKV